MFVHKEIYLSVHTLPLLSTTKPIDVSLITMRVQSALRSGSPVRLSNK